MDSDALVTLASDLIRAPSPSGQEGPAAEVLARAFRELGFDEVRRDEAGNVLGVLRRGEGPVVMLNGHLDTVPVGDAALWPHPPLSGAVVDGRLWGRGACDMKSALACMTLAAADAARTGFSGTLVVAGVVQEEVGGLGARYLGETLPADVIVLGEPSKLDLMLGHRGRIELEVRFPGRIAHAAKAELGENALYHAARFLAKLEGAVLPSGGPLVASSATPTQLLTFPEGGVNMVPGSAVLTVDYRTIPGDDEATVLRRLRELADDPRVEITVPTEYAQSEEGRLRREFPRSVDPYLAPGESPVIETARRTLRSALSEVGRRFGERTWWFATDAPHLVRSGGVVVGFGPGEEELAHTTEESVEVDSLHAARAGYRALCHAYLGEGGGRR
ncbi:MAG: M20/M25/M40 family metallo-hydrolase [Deinococcales bacterium]